ncbi:transposon Ty3-I Gag-Pol polyprotein [Trichonephila clavipes]|nr:transposon Ty3-I Gag-Pol polyprotein [Trichonephila clavipes]
MYCRECQRRKSVRQKSPGLLIPIPPASVPFQRDGIDLLGRFPRSTKGNKGIIVCTDYLSRFAVTKALITAEPEEVAKFITGEIALKHGASRTIFTDRGKVFKSKLVTELGQLCSSKHRKTTGYHPQTNRLTERFNKTLADMLSMYDDVEKTNCREAKTTLDIVFLYIADGSEDDYVSRLITRAEESRQLARIRTLEAQHRDKTRYDTRHWSVSY